MLDRLSSSRALYTFSLTLIMSAFLLFWLEPLIGKMILPILGGVPAVWNTCMLFFQAMLLAGYGYAFLTTRFLNHKAQIILHCCLMLLALFFLPISLPANVSSWLIQDPVAWLLSFLLMTIGLPFLVIGATAPLLQHWYARIQVGPKDPYFLYSASNLGSMLALIAFPFLLEPHWPLQHQSIWWRNTYVILFLLLIGCAMTVWRSNSQRVPASQASIADDSLIIPNTLLRLRWLLLAFVPSSLLLSITAYLTADVAAVPLFWLVPLALYILSFIIVFAKKPIISNRFPLLALPILLGLFLILPLGYQRLNYSIYIILQIVIYLSLLFCVALAAHGQLVAKRPQVKYLTEFYWWIALGGALGGVFNVLIAPYIFTYYWELPIVLAMAIFLLPSKLQKPGKYFSIIIVVLLSIPLIIFKYVHIPSSSFNIYFSMVVIAVFCLIKQRWAFAIGATLLLFLGRDIYHYDYYKLVTQQRNFFGIIRVIDVNDKRILLNGSTLHGMQNLTLGQQRQILSYYWSLASLFNTVNKELPKTHVGVVGLGTGTLACYARSQDQFDFYEINPAVIKIANNNQIFSLISACTPHARMILGDARLSLRTAPPHTYHFLIMDAFNSDAIPVHLLTIEALQLYLNKLTPDGILLFHISNRYLNLAPVLQAAATQLHLPIYQLEQSPLDKNPYLFSSTWIAIASSKHAEQNLKQAGWTVLAQQKKIKAWSDTFSNILSVIK